jgi:octaheme c-type cytochrome (tetrathionate reductase family)
MNIKALTPFLLLIGLSPLLAQDHKENLSGPYENIQQITEECLMCHDDSGAEVLQSNHWNWLTSNITDSTVPETTDGKHIPINNFCIAVPGNLTQCNTCHLPFSEKDESFDFNAAENIDCLVCHDQTGTYKRSPFGTGLPEAEIDLLAAAQSVGKPAKDNCGTCHFSGSGGVMMKSGVMDKSLLNPTEEIDYHIGGLGFGCSDCHETKSHNISARNESGESPVACENCHDAEPHKKELLNQHSSAVACQTCHIPTYARTEPAIVWWDWSKAGEDRESVKNEFGEETYYKSKGELVWAKNIRPEYYWNNGSDDYYELGEKNEKAKLIDLNKPAGKISDPDSKISPFKVMKIKQPYDPVNKYLIIPRLYGEAGYSKTTNWVSASEKGMKEVNLEFSGQVDFMETKMYWQINHLVVSSDNALKCISCHGKGGEGLLKWKELGYPDDPIKKGGRVKNKLVKE